MPAEYDQYLTKYYSQDTAQLQWNAASVLDHHGAHFPAQKSAAILEIGPGTGAMLSLLRDGCGYSNIKAIDVSPEAVQTCNQILPGSTELVNDAAAFLQERGEAFDFIYMLHTMEHIPKEQVLPLVKAIHVALKPGGKFVVEVPNSEHPVVGTRNRYADFTHTLGFTDLSLKFVLQNGGFSNAIVYGCRIPRRSVSRILQRAAQDTVEFVLGMMVRLYRPNDSLIMSSILGACATK